MAKRSAKPEPAKTLTVLPVQLRLGDTFTDDAGTWEMVGQPRSQRARKSVAARVQRPGDPGTLREQWWQAYERVSVTRRADSRGLTKSLTRSELRCAGCEPQCIT
jgi:hypothetical protein